MPFRPSTDLAGFVDYQSAARRRFFLPSTLNPTDWMACGVFSIHHCLVLLGQGVALSQVKGSHPTWWHLACRGLDDHDLRRIVARGGGRSEAIVSGSLGAVRRFVDRHLRAAHPVILTSGTARHWCVVGGRTRDGGYVTVDSAETPPVNVYSWDALAEWLGDGENEAGAVAVLPGTKMPASRSVVRSTDGIWKLWRGDRWLASEWSNLLEDMLTVFWDRDVAPRGVGAGEFIDSREDALDDAVRSVTGAARADSIGWLRGYRNAAEFHDLVVDRGQEDATVARLAMVLQARLGGDH